MKNVKVIKKAAIFLMVFVLAFSSLSAAAAVTYSRGGKSEQCDKTRING